MSKKLNLIYPSQLRQQKFQLDRHVPVVRCCWRWDNSVYRFQAECSVEKNWRGLAAMVEPQPICAGAWWLPRSHYGQGCLPPLPFGRSAHLLCQPTLLSCISGALCSWACILFFCMIFFFKSGRFLVVLSASACRQETVWQPACRLPTASSRSTANQFVPLQCWSISRVKTYTGSRLQNILIAAAKVAIPDFCWVFWWISCTTTRRTRSIACAKMLWMLGEAWMTFSGWSSPKTGFSWRPNRAFLRWTFWPYGIQSQMPVRVGVISSSCVFLI